MKIFINGKFLLAKLEGMPRVGREITGKIDKLLGFPEFSDLSVEIVVPKGGRRFAEYENIKIHEIGRFSGPLWEQFDFPLYIRGNYSLNFTATAPIISRNGCVVVHDAQFKSTKESHTWKSFILYNVITSIVARTYRQVTTVSEYAKEELRKFNVTRRLDVEVIHLGADHFGTENGDDSILGRLRVESGSYALTNSYIHKHKNVQTLLQSFETLPDKKLVLFGTTKRHDYEAAGIPVPPNAVFAGRVTDAELAALMLNARLFLFPSTTEGFGLPPLEAMQHGTPTIVSRAGAMPEVCGNGCVYVDDFMSPTAWAFRISELWNDNAELEKLKQAGLTVAATYTWEKAARRYLDLFMRIQNEDS